MGRGRGAIAGDLRCLSRGRRQLRSIPPISIRVAKAKSWSAGSSPTAVRATTSSLPPSSRSNGSANPLAATQAGGGNPNAGGAGAKNIHRALDASLKRLGTDYIDLYWMHIWDGVTPVEEIVQTLGDLVRAGKIRYYGLSDMPAWLAMKAATIATERRIPGPIAMQLEYSLVARGRRERAFPGRRGRPAWASCPGALLRGGFLSGKYQRGNTTDTGRLSGANPFGNSKFVDRNWGHPRRAEGRCCGARSTGGAGSARLDPRAFRSRVNTDRR